MSSSGSDASVSGSQSSLLISIEQRDNVFLPRNVRASERSLYEKLKNYQNNTKNWRRSRSTLQGTSDYARSFIESEVKSIVEAIGQGSGGMYDEHNKLSRLCSDLAIVICHGYSISAECLLKEEEIISMKTGFENMLGDLLEKEGAGFFTLFPEEGGDVVAFQDMLSIAMQNRELKILHSSGAFRRRPYDRRDSCLIVCFGYILTFAFCYEVLKSHQRGDDETGMVIFGALMLITLITSNIVGIYRCCYARDDPIDYAANICSQLDAIWVKRYRMQMPENDELGMDQELRSWKGSVAILDVGDHK